MYIIADLIHYLITMHYSLYTVLFYTLLAIFPPYLQKDLIWQNLQGRWGFYKGGRKTFANQWSSKTGVVIVWVSWIKSACQNCCHHLRICHPSLNCDILSGNIAWVQTLQSFQYNCQWHQSGRGRGKYSKFYHGQIDEQF